MRLAGMAAVAPKDCFVPLCGTRNDTLSARHFILRRHAQAAFSLVEILIAMFVFLVGVLGVLSIFPVAMHSAGRSTGEVRSTILAQNVIAQMNADSQAAYERGMAADNSSSADKARQLVRTGNANTGCFVTLTSGPGKWQSRLIYADTAPPRPAAPGPGILSVVPDWEPVPSAGWTGPGVGDAYVVTRMGLPLPPTTPLGVRSGYVRKIFGSAIYAGKVDPTDPLLVAPLTNPDWPTGITTWKPPDPALGTTAATGGGTSWVERTGAVWTPHDYRGKLVVLIRDGTLDGPAVGQVRWITDNTNSRLDVYPDWDSTTPPADWALVDFEIYDSLGYFLIITSGRASGRIFPITGFQIDPDGGTPTATGDRITCAGVNFSGLNVKAAERGLDHPLSNADSFAIIGGPSTAPASTLLTAFPIVSVGPVYPSYVFNSFGRRNTADRQTGADLYARGGIEKEASDFGLITILSAEDRPDLSAEDRKAAPVRVDVFVFRNYDSAKSPQDNQRALGYMTGYIGRPKP